MTLIACVDERMGMAFNGRRQSRDRMIYLDLAGLSRGAPLYTHPRSITLFESLGIPVAPADSRSIPPEGWYFDEFESPSGLIAAADQVILYCWNRHYPADLRFDASLDGWTLLEERDFPGSSHERITRRIYEHGSF